MSQSHPQPARPSQRSSRSPRPAPGRQQPASHTVATAAPAGAGAPGSARALPDRAAALAAQWAPLAARVLLGLVLGWFGYHELVHPALWTGYVPAPATSLIGGHARRSRPWLGTAHAGGCTDSRHSHQAHSGNRRHHALGDRRLADRNGGPVRPGPPRCWRTWPGHLPDRSHPAAPGAAPLTAARPRPVPRRHRRAVSALTSAGQTTRPPDIPRFPPGPLPACCESQLTRSRLAVNPNSPAARAGGMPVACGITPAGPAHTQAEVRLPPGGRPRLRGGGAGLPPVGGDGPVTTTSTSAALPLANIGSALRDGWHHRRGGSTFLSQAGRDDR